LLQSKKNVQKRTENQTEKLRRRLQIEQHLSRVYSGDVSKTYPECSSSKTKYFLKVMFDVTVALVNMGSIQVQRRNKMPFTETQNPAEKSKHL